MGGPSTPAQIVRQSSTLVTSRARPAPVCWIGVPVRLPASDTWGSGSRIRGNSWRRAVLASRILTNLATNRVLHHSRARSGYLRSLQPSSEPRRPPTEGPIPLLPARRFRRLVTAAVRPGSTRAPRQGQPWPGGLPDPPVRWPARPTCPNGRRAVAPRCAGAPTGCLWSYVPTVGIDTIGIVLGAGSAEGELENQLDRRRAPFLGFLNQHLGNLSNVLFGDGLDKRLAQGGDVVS